MIAEKPNWIRHEGLQIFSIDVQAGGLRFATGGGDHKVGPFPSCHASSLPNVQCGIFKSGFFKCFFSFLCW